MNSPISEDSFLKGKQFEDFVQNVLFPKSLYELLYRTPPYQQNSQRFVTSTVQPDFQLKSLVDGKVFYVEAKYRSKTYQDKYDPRRLFYFVGLHRLRQLGSHKGFLWNAIGC